jgi:hypothetical protein
VSAFISATDCYLLDIVRSESSYGPRPLDSRDDGNTLTPHASDPERLSQYWRSPSPCRHGLGHVQPHAMIDISISDQIISWSPVSVRNVNVCMAS